MSIKAMKMALEALELGDDINAQQMSDAMKALRQTIEQAEKQGVLIYRTGYESGYRDASVAIKREWVGLTGEEITTLVNSLRFVPVERDYIMAEMIEAKLKEKNA